MTSFEQICTSDSIFQRHLLPYLTAKELGRLEGTSKALRPQEDAWKVLCQRDFVSTKQAPVYDGETFDGETFFRAAHNSTYKESYQHWTRWKRWTHGAAKASDMVLAMDLWDRFKQWCERNGLMHIVQSLHGTPPETTFAEMVRFKYPSSFVAFISVHGGQWEGLSAVFGCYNCYSDVYSMRWDFFPSLTQNGTRSIVVGITPAINVSGVSVERRMELTFSKRDPEGSVSVNFGEASNYEGTRIVGRIVGRGGILSYFSAYVGRLEAGVYPARQLVPGRPETRFISLFPDSGATCSCAVTRGIQVRASARWIPSADSADSGSLNFGYSIRIQLVDADDALEGTCQLVGRHWMFTDGNGQVEHVNGAAVVGLQPLFFRGSDGKSGYVNLGPAGDGERFTDCVFSYQSQSGPVSGTTVEDTGQASVRGSFSFVPGSIEEPQGEMFHVTVAPFPLSVSLPFY